MADQHNLDLTTILRWAVGVMFTLIGFFALLVASRAGGSLMYWIGIGMFLLCVLAIFFMIAKSFDSNK